MADENKENIQEPAADPAKTEQAALIEQPEQAPNSNNKHHARSKSPPQPSIAGPPTLHTSNRQSTGPTRFNRDIVRDEARKIHLGNRSHHEKLDDSVGQNIERLLLLSKVAHPSYSIPYKQLLAEVEENENKVFTQVPKALTPRTGRTKRSGVQDSVGPRVQTRNDDYAEYVKQRPVTQSKKPIVEKDKPLTKPNVSQIWKAASRSKFMDPTLYEKPEGAVTRREEIAMRREKAAEKQQQILAASRPAQSASFAPKRVATAKVPDAKNFVPACAERTPADHGESARKERAEHAKAKKSGFRF